MAKPITPPMAVMRTLHMFIVMPAWNIVLKPRRANKPMMLLMIRRMIFFRIMNMMMMIIATMIKMIKPVGIIL